MADRIFCGNGKTMSGQYGEFYNLSLKLSELEKYVSDKGYVRVTVSKAKNTDQYGNDLSVCINDFKPKTTTPKSVNDELDFF